MGSDGWLPPPRIRPKAVCLLRDRDRILVTEGQDPRSHQRFLHLIGGAIEFGEMAADAARRELLEEVGVMASGIELLGVLENIYNYGGVQGHEIAFVFEVEPADTSIYERETVQVLEVEPRPAFWVGLEELRTDPRPLYPEGILDIAAEAHSRRGE
jgi:ADP-ribose pyrophosphatase YjhB (NUDIX family)